MPSSMPNQDAVEKITAPTNLSQGSSRANILIADSDEDYRELYSDPPIRCNQQKLKATVFRIIDSLLNFIRGLPESFWVDSRPITSRTPQSRPNEN